MAERAATRRVYADESVEVRFQRGRAKGELWVTFSAYQDRGPFAVGQIAKRGARALHVIARHDHWFQPLDATAVRRLIERCRPTPEARVLGLGASMGGFGLLAWARDLGIDSYIASAPQVVIDEAVCAGHDERWIEEWRVLKRAGRLVRPSAADHLTGVSGVVLYDPFDPQDAWQVRRIAESPALLLMSLPFSGHAALADLSAGGALEGVLAAVADGKTDDLRTRLVTFSKGRKERYAYWCELGMRLHRTGRSAAALRTLGAAARRWPTHHVAHYYLSVIHEEAGDLTAALACSYDAAAQARHDVHWSLFERLAHLHACRGELMQAEGAYRAGLARLPASAILHAKLANFLIVTLPEREREALSLLGRSVELEPANGRYQKALSDSQAVLAPRLQLSAPGAIL